MDYEFPNRQHRLQIQWHSMSDWYYCIEFQNRIYWQCREVFLALQCNVTYKDWKAVVLRGFPICARRFFFHRQKKNLDALLV